MAGLVHGSALMQKTAVQSFWNGYFGIPDMFEGLVATSQSTQKTDTRAWLGAAPMPEEWVGDKDVKDANEYSDTLTNKAWSSAVGVGKELIKYEQWSEISGLISNLGEKARAHRTKKLSALLETGVSATGEDGQFYFDVDHSSSGAEYTTSQVNDLTIAIADSTAPTDLEFAASVRRLRQQYYTFKDDRGDPTVPAGSLNASNFVVMVAPGYMSVAEQVANSSQLTGPVGNDMQNMFQVRVNPFLAAPATTKAIYGFYIHPTRKPFILQLVSDVALEDTLGGDENFATGGINYSATWWGEVTFGEWRTACIEVWTDS